MTGSFTCWKNSVFRPTKYGSPHEACVLGRSAIGFPNSTSLALTVGTRLIGFSRAGIWRLSTSDDERSKLRNPLKGVHTIHPTASTPTTPYTMEEACPMTKERVLHAFESYVVGRNPGFGKDIGDRIVVKDLLYSTQDLQAVAICEMVVEEDMLDSAMKTLHIGCAAYLIDMCTALPFILLSAANNKSKNALGPPSFSMAPFAPSQRLDMVFPHPAPIGTPIRIIGRTITHISLVLFVQGEIWDVSKNRLVASATHVKVMPKAPPPAALAKL